jgi:predicted nuclease with TOPRIM domain
MDPLADDAVKAYVADRRADGATASGLRAAWEIRQALVAGHAQQEKLRTEQQERQRATEETRANLKSLEKNGAAADLRAKLTARLAADSTKLDDLGKRLIETNLRLAEAQIRFTEAIRAIKLSQPLAAE